MVNYTTTLQIVKMTGIGIEIYDEIVGTGTGSLANFDLDNGNIITGSYSLYYGASGSNTMTALTDVTHYVLSKNEGRIVLTAAGITALATNILYASYIYSPKMSDSIISSYLDSSDKEVDRKTGNYWGASLSETEYFSGRSTIYPTTDEPFATDWDEPDSVMLRYRGVLTITIVKFITRGTTTTTETLASTDYDFDPVIGKLVFLTRRIPNGTRNVEVIYTHGYSTVDPQVSELAAYFAGLKVFGYMTGGSYDDATGYTLGRKQVQIGEVYVNVREVTRQFETRIQSIIEDLGGKSNVC